MILKKKKKWQEHFKFLPSELKSKGEVLELALNNSTSLSRELPSSLQKMSLQMSEYITGNTYGETGTWKRKELVNQNSSSVYPDSCWTSPEKAPVSSVIPSKEFTLGI